MVVSSDSLDALSGSQQRSQLDKAMRWRMGGAEYQPPQSARYRNETRGYIFADFHEARTTTQALRQICSFKPALV